MRGLWMVALCLWTESSGVKKAEKVTGILGESVVFHLKTSAGFRQMFWLRTSTKIFAVVKEEQPCQLMVVDQALEGRLNVSEDCRSLQISDLHQNDSDTYLGQIPLGRYWQEEVFDLQVYKRLSESDLEVQCEKNNLSDGHQTWQLNCSVGMWENCVKYSWTSASNTEVLFSRIYRIVQHDSSHDLNLTCVARNPIGNVSKTVSAKQTCEGITNSPSGQSSYTVIGVTIAALIVAKPIISMCVLAKWPSSSK